MSNVLQNISTYRYRITQVGKIPVIFALKHIFCISPFEYFLCGLPSFGYLECVLMGAEVEPAILLTCPVQAGQAAVQVVDHTLQAGQAAVQVVDHTLQSTGWTGSCTGCRS